MLCWSGARSLSVGGLDRSDMMKERRVTEEKKMEGAIRS